MCHYRDALQFPTRKLVVVMLELPVSLLPPRGAFPIFYMNDRFASIISARWDSRFVIDIHCEICATR